MALYKRPDSRYWWMEFEFETRRHQLSTKCRNKRDAEKFEAAYRTQLANDKVDLRPKRSALTFQTAAQEFLAWSKLQQKESTFRRYETSSKALIKYFGPRLVTEIDRANIEKFVAWRSSQKKKAPVRKLKVKPNTVTRDALRPATINRELACFRIIFNRLLDQNRITKNPAARFPFLPEDNEQMRVLTPTEERIYLDTCGQPLHDVAVIMLETGMRPSEVYALRKTDINFEQGYVQVSKGKTKAARRKVPLSKTARETFYARILSSTPGPYVFAGGLDGKSEVPIVKLTNAHIAAVVRSGLPAFRQYDLRHTFATRAVEAGVDLVTLMVLLGHSRLEMVLKYAHPSEAHGAAAIQKMADHRETHCREKRRDSLHIPSIAESSGGNEEAAKEIVFTTQ